MKIKTISRDATHHTRECVSHKQKVFRNADPKLHPMEKAREVRCLNMCTASLLLILVASPRRCCLCRQYQRALVATKLERMYAKPFIGALDGHSDSVNCCATSRNSLVRRGELSTATALLHSLTWPRVSGCLCKRSMRRRVEGVGSRTQAMRHTHVWACADCHWRHVCRGRPNILLMWRRQLHQAVGVACGRRT